MSDWKLEYRGLDPSGEGLREALCTLGNGYCASRGAAEESHAGEVHYPGTYLAGGYNRLKSEISGKVIENEDLVNWPNWLFLSFRIEGEDKWFSLEETNVIDYVQSLDLEKGTLTRNMHFIDKKGREVKIISSRLLSMDRPHMAAIRWVFTPVNWSGRIVVRSAIDGSVKNQGVKRYQKLNGHHLNIIEKGSAGDKNIYLMAQTSQSRIYMAQAASCKIYENGIEIEAGRETREEGKIIAQELTFNVEAQRPVNIEKTVAIYTSRDRAISEPLTEAQSAINEDLDFDSLMKKHSEAWSRIWKRFNINLNTSGNTQMLLHLHIFHLLQTCSRHTIGRDIGIPARGWHGEAYRGHIFWDELFIFPLLNFRMPALTRSLLLYRFYRLNAARKLAKDNNCRGAMFPWQSGSNGREESQVVHLNPQSGKWVPDNTYLQRHVNLAIAYNIWQYYEVTADAEFMKFFGAEMILEIARFFACIVSWNQNKSRYEILKVVGPDEFHTAYPNSDEPGIDNNAYTNVMCSWLFNHALKTLSLLDENRSVLLLKKLDISDIELGDWRVMSQKLFVPFLGKGILEQFEGYGDLKEFDWEGYGQKYGDIHRLDRILNSEGDSVNNYKASKQADVLMLFYLFSSEELLEIFQMLGYEFDAQSIPENVEYYVKRNSNGSTLSRIVRAWVVARSDREGAWEGFREAIVSDVDDVQGGTTPEGIHLGSMAGTVDIIQRCFTGLEIRDDVLWLNPYFPEDLKSLSMNLCYRGVWLNISIDKDKFEVSAEEDMAPQVNIGYKTEIVELKPGTVKTFLIRET